jgi:hypothetical protein
MIYNQLIYLNLKSEWIFFINLLFLILNRINKYLFFSLRYVKALEHEYIKTYYLDSINNFSLVLHE